MSLIKDNSEQLKVVGARVRDVITGKEWNINAKCVINATGPFTDAIRKMDDEQAENIVKPSAGVLYSRLLTLSVRGHVVVNGGNIYCCQWGPRTPRSYHDLRFILSIALPVHTITYALSCQSRFQFIPLPTLYLVNRAPSSYHHLRFILSIAYHTP